MITRNKVFSLITFLLAAAILLLATTGCESPEGGKMFDKSPPTVTPWPTPTVVQEPTPAPTPVQQTSSGPASSRKLPIQSSDLIDLINTAMMVVLGLAFIGGLIFLAIYLANKFLDKPKEKKSPTSIMKTQRSAKKIEEMLGELESNIDKVTTQAKLMAEGTKEMLREVAGIHKLMGLYSQAYDILTGDSIDTKRLSRIVGEMRPVDPVMSARLDEPHLWTSGIKEQIVRRLNTFIGTMKGIADRYEVEADALDRNVQEYQDQLELLKLEQDHYEQELPTLEAARWLSMAQKNVEAIRALTPRKSHRKVRSWSLPLPTMFQRLGEPVTPAMSLMEIEQATGEVIDARRD